MSKNYKKNIYQKIIFRTVKPVLAATSEQQPPVNSGGLDYSQTDTNT
jgi:hypothetical protein